MSVSLSQFWQLLADSHLVSSAESQRLGQEFGYVKGASAQGNARTLSEWLISRQIISRYHSTILLAGRAGPFLYGEYKIYDRVGQGPQSGCFKAMHMPTGHPVLLQFLSGEVTGNPQMWHRVAVFAQKHCAVQHPQLNRCFELVDLVSFKFMVMEDPQGQPLEQRLAAHGKLPPAEAARVLWQAAQGAAHLHGAGLVHGDIRPPFVSIDGQGNAKLWRDPLWLPQTLLNGHADARTAARADYAAPEFSQRGKSPDVLTDVYALGCTLYHALSGRVPFEGGDVHQKLNRHASEAIAPLEPLGVPQPLAQATAYMMAKNPSVRYPQASVVVEKLAEFVPLSHRQTASPAPSTLGAFERHVKAKQQVLQAQAAAQASSATADRSEPASFPGIAFGGAASAATATSAAVAGTAQQTAAAEPVEPAPGPNSERLRKKQPLSKNKPLLITLIAGGAFLLLAAALFFSGALTPSGGGGTNVAAGDDEDLEDNSGSQGTTGETKNGDDTPTASTPALEDSPYEIVEADDGRTLYAPPTWEAPLDLAYVPSDAKIYLAARPSEILSSPHGAAALKALGPDFAALRQRWERDAGVTLNEVEQLVIGIHSAAGQMPRVSSMVRLKSPVDMKTRWGNPAPAGSPDRFRVGTWEMWLPPGGGGRVFVMGGAEEIDPLSKSPLEIPRPVLRRDFQRLLETSHGGRHVTAIFDPHFFHTDGRKLFRGQYAKLVEAFDWFFGDNVQGMLSLHFGSDFYGELRLYAGLTRTPGELQSEFDQKLTEMPQGITRYVNSLGNSDYWGNLQGRFPVMVSYARRHARIGMEGDQTVINLLLPGFTAPNLLAASELSINSQPGGTSVTPTVKVPKNIDELLASKIDLSFSQQSLEFSMRDVVQAANDEYPQLPFNFQIKLVGADLEKDGITRNQQVRDFQANEVAISDILTQLVMKANPITTVTDPSQADQKLVWVVQPDPEDVSRKIVLITTRAAATSKSYPLPSVFQPK